MNNSTMRYRTKEEQVADFLRQGIISGRFPRGTRLKQQEIAAMLDSSITPVREALKLLAAEGYVIGDSYRGATVAPFDFRASEEILHLRILLETQLIRGTISRMGPRDMDILLGLQKEFERAIDASENEAARAANYRFHQYMYEISGMPQTLHLAQTLWARYPFDLINKLGGRVSRAASEHGELLEALIASDIAAAMLAIRRHIESGWSELKKAFESGQLEEQKPTNVQVAEGQISRRHFA